MLADRRAKEAHTKTKTHRDLEASTKMTEWARRPRQRRSMETSKGARRQWRDHEASTRTTIKSEMDATSARGTRETTGVCAHQLCQRCTANDNASGWATHLHALNSRHQAWNPLHTFISTWNTHKFYSERQTMYSCHACSLSVRCVYMPATFLMSFNS